MAAITYDGQSFMVDSRRVWLVSGSIQYARIPRQYWASRIGLAKQAGLNTIETPVFWARHEARQGQFDFAGDNDLRHFVGLVGQAGMYCILRPGPYIGADWDLGGLPPWLLGLNNIRLRTASAPFLEACSRYITAVAAQVRDLQVTSPGGGGPIILVQSESGWTCGDDALAGTYLGELKRYYREAGLTVPTINANDLWQAAEGEIDCWTGFDDLLGHLRQLATVRPEQPRLVVEFRVGNTDTWGRPACRDKTPAMILRRLAQVLAAGGQFNIDPFCGGTNFGFSGGRVGEEPDGFVTASYDRGAPVSELGQPGPAYKAVRRLCTFASRFGRLLSHLDPKRQSVTLHPDSSPKGAHSVVHATGPQGSVVFIFGDEDPDLPPPGEPGRGVGSLLLPDGTTLPFDIGSQPVAWFVFDARLNGRAHLDYCNLSVFAAAGRSLVCFGPAGALGVVSISGSPLEVTVPRGKNPLVVDHEGVLVVVANTEQIDTIYLEGETVYLGVGGLTREGQPVAHAEHRLYTCIAPDGQVSTRRARSPGAHGAHAKSRTRAKGGRAHSVGGPVVGPAAESDAFGQLGEMGAAGGRIRLGEWAVAEATDYTSGQSARFASIAGPADLNSLGSAYGYGWYRLRFKSATARKQRVIFDRSGDRLHVWADGHALGVVGRGPGATNEALLALSRTEHTLVVLAENLGRPSGGADLAQRTGLCGHAWVLRPVRTARPKLTAGMPVDVLAFRSPLWHVHMGETTDPARLTWRVAHRRKTPLVVTLPATEAAGLVLVNDKPVHYFERGSPGRLMLEPDRLSRGKNVVQVAFLGSTAAHAPELARTVEFAEAQRCLTAKAEWAFAKWEPPARDAFKPAGARPARRTRSAAGPCWWRTIVTPDDSGLPVVLEATGLTKGQIYLNNRHVGRYFVSTADGRPVGPQVRYHIPRPWFIAGAPNELLIFDEHGGSPAHCRLLADAHAALME